MYDFLDKIGLKAVLEAIKGKMSEYASKALYGDTTINVGREAGSAVGEYSTAIGHNTTASGYSAYSQGSGAKASGTSSHAEGEDTIASDSAAHAEGISTHATANASHAEGVGTTASGVWSHAEGDNTTASSDASHAEGDKTAASGASSHAEGSGAKATANASHAEGNKTVASGASSHAEGNNTTADGYYSHAEGYYTIAGETASHAEGKQTTASGPYSHAEGAGANASGVSSHAEGSSTTAIGAWSHAEGQFTIANNDAEHASGRYNLSNEDTLFSIGDGTAEDARHNAFEITKTGGKLHDKDIATTDLIPTIPTSLPANGGNADTVDGVHAWNMHTLTAGGGSYGSGLYLMYCKYNVLGNNKFYIGVTDGYDRAVAVNFAENADTVDDIHIHCANDGTSGLSWFAVFETANDIRAIDPARAYVGSSGGVTCSLIGTASGCQYSTILAWANAQATATFASVVAATGFPSDAPYQQEALLQVQVDYYHQRKIVTWTRYLGGQAPQIRQRAIFGTDWNDSDWRVVCG